MTAVTRTSFRDPDGHVVREEGRVFRYVRAEAAATLDVFLQSRCAENMTGAGRLVATRRDQRTGASKEWIRYEHDPIWFPCYPYEWPPEMLHTAAELTLDFADALLETSLGLKDATPFNVLFRGPGPVFVDVLSVERRDPRDPIWMAEAQFERTFLLPLLASQEFGLPPGVVFMLHRDGLEPEQLYSWSSVMQKVAPRFLWSVTIPAILHGKAKQQGARLYRPVRVQDPRRADFALRHLYRRLRRRLRQVAPEHRSSYWAGYAQGGSYTESDLQAKVGFVRDSLVEQRAKRVLDIGCNTGTFAQLAARGGASVVAIDRDAVAVGQLWRKAVAENLDVLPLVVDISRPTPSTGWCNEEAPSFLERSENRFDAVLMLALVHHLLVAERVPLSAVVDLSARLTTSLLVVEYVGTEDPMFQILARGRTPPDQYNRDAFEQAFMVRFEVTGSRRTGADRYLYSMRRRGNA